MKPNQNLLIVLVASWLSMPATAQQRPSSSLFLKAEAQTDVVIPFRVDDAGIKLPVRWGLDVAWNNEQNMRKGINFIGKDNLSVARSSFQMNNALIGDTALTNSQIQMLRQRTATINILGNNTDVILNADQGDGSSNYIINYYTQNNQANTAHWARLIDATMAWMQKNYSRHHIIAVSPFNEPDYTSWNEGTQSDFKEIARLLKEDYPRFQDIAITAGNTLNDDYASAWYNAVKPYATWGNTHQLAGSFDNFANFWTEVVNDGNYPYADELHNVGEAMIAANYGMKMGIWWGFDSRARGEFCQMSNHGSRLAYGEDRDHWTAASVYRDDSTQEVKAFVGGSERQANNSSYLFVSPEEDVYFDGKGPTRAFRMTYPGGTGYQKGQTNAERVYDITRGDDVPPTEVTSGRYALLNRRTRQLVTSGARQGDELALQQQGTADLPALCLWDIEPVDSRIGGDYSFYTFTNSANQMHMNVLNNSTYPAIHVITYDAGNASNEQWSLQYAGNGFYYIRNRESGLYLSLPGVSASYVLQKQMGATTVDRQLQQWRLLPEGSMPELRAPSAPTMLMATPQPASVSLSWTVPTDNDVLFYEVIRGQADNTHWSTIARGITTTTFIDNTCRQGHDYIYKVKAVDQSLNISKASEGVVASPTAAKSLVAHWTFEGTTNDRTVNMMDAVCSSQPHYLAEHQEGDSAINLNGNYLRLPYGVADQDEMTIAMWIRWTNSSQNWTRLFDFGNGTSQYMFLTPSNGNVMRFAIKNGGEEQTVDAALRLKPGTWHHVAVTIGTGRVALWLDGEEVGSSSSITIKPSDIHPVLNYIGRSQFNADPLLKGILDDIRIYNYPLTQQELQQIIAEPTAIHGTKTVQVPVAQVLKTYNLSGQPVKDGYHGVVISKGKKEIKK